MGTGRVDILKLFSCFYHTQWYAGQAAILFLCHGIKWLWNPHWYSTFAYLCLKQSLHSQEPLNITSWQPLHTLNLHTGHRSPRLNRKPNSCRQRRHVFFWSSPPRNTLHIRIVWISCFSFLKRNNIIIIHLHWHSYMGDSSWYEPLC